MALNIERDVKYQYQYICNVLKGGPINARLEFTAAVKNDESDTYMNIRQGSLVSLDPESATPEFVIGCPAGSGSNYPMPMWSVKNIFDPDVLTGSQKSSTWIGGQITAYVATGGFELETSEFDTTQTYKPGDALTGAEDTGKANGKITKSTETIYANTKPIVGIVSAGKRVDQYKVNRLAFWPVFFPATRGGGGGGGGQALTKDQADTYYAPITGSANYAPATGSPNYAPSIGSPNYAPISGSANYVAKTTYDAHTHSGVTTGSDNTGAPNA